MDKKNTTVGGTVGYFDLRRDGIGEVHVDYSFVTNNEWKDVGSFLCFEEFITELQCSKNGISFYEL